MSIVANIPLSAQGFRSAPWNDVEMTCPHCLGKGEWFIHYDDNDNELRIEWEEWRTLSPEQKREWDRERCPHCDGTGTIWK